MTYPRSCSSWYASWTADPSSSDSLSMDLQIYSAVFDSPWQPLVEAFLETPPAWLVVFLYQTIFTASQWVVKIPVREVTLRWRLHEGLEPCGWQREGVGMTSGPSHRESRGGGRHWGNWSVKEERHFPSTALYKHRRDRGKVAYKDTLDVSLSFRGEGLSHHGNTITFPPPGWRQWGVTLKQGHWCFAVLSCSHIQGRIALSALRFTFQGIWGSKLLFPSPPPPPVFS